MRLQIRRAVYDPVDVDPADTCTMKEARALTGLSYPALLAAIHRGALTELFDAEHASYRQMRRYLLRAELEALTAKRPEA